MLLPDLSKTDGKHIAVIGDKLFIIGRLMDKHSHFSRSYIDSDAYYVPTVMAKDAELSFVSSKHYKVLWLYNVKPTKPVVFIGWTYLFIGEYHENYGGQGYLTDRESVLVLTVMPYERSGRYRKPFHVLPSQVISVLFTSCPIR